MKTFSGSIARSTKGNNHILDLTGDLLKLVEESGVRTGQLVAMVIGSTAGLTTMEFEPGLANHDIAAAMERVAPEDGHYVHEGTWGDNNGHSHVRAALMGASVALPIVESRLPLGTWQQVVLVDFDTRPRERSIVVTIVGE